MGCQMSVTSSEVINSLKELPGTVDPYLSKRKEHRTNLQARARLDLRLADGETVTVSALDVSNSGIGLLSRSSLPVSEKIGLRIAFHHESEFEVFIVRRETGTLGGYKVGVAID